MESFHKTQVRMLTHLERQYLEEGPRGSGGGGVVGAKWPGPWVACSSFPQS